MADVRVTVSMDPLELKLFRRALAKAADDGVLHRTMALSRICELDVLRWNAEDAEERHEGKPRPEWRPQMNMKAMR